MLAPTDGNKRAMERFPLNLEGTVKAVGQKKSPPCRLVTQDVCAGGAFFLVDQPLPLATEVSVELVLSTKTLQKLARKAGKKIFLRLQGRVVRATSQGMAVKFGNNYNIISQ